MNATISLLRSLLIVNLICTLLGATFLALSLGTGWTDEDLRRRVFAVGKDK